MATLMTVAEETVSASAAQELVTASTNKAAELGVAVVVVVVDGSGNLKAFLRMDGAALGTIEVAQAKAQTAVSFGMSSDAWYGIAKDVPEFLHSLPHLPRFTMLGGGHPIVTSGRVVGAIGVSGAPSGEQDTECARAALTEVGFA